MYPVFSYNIGHEEIDAAVKALKGKSLTRGTYTEKFQYNFSKYIGSKHCLVVNSGTSSLETALELLQLDRGGEIIMPSLTCRAAVDAVILKGGTPVFVDIDPDYFFLNPVKAAEAISSKTKAIMVVHLYGGTGDIKKISSIATNHHVSLIEDCAHSVGSEFDNRKLGSFGNLASFSFYQIKPMTTGGEGGALLLKEDMLYKKGCYLVGTTDFGHRSELKNWQSIISEKSAQFSYPGHNLRMTEMQAAIGLVQLKKVDKLNRKRRVIAGKIDEIFSAYSKYITIPKIHPKARHSFYVYTAKINSNYKEWRNKLMRSFFKNGIMTSLMYCPPQHLQKVYRGKIKVGQLRQTETISKQILSIPVNPYLERKKLNDFLNKVEKSMKVFK